MRSVALYLEDDGDGAAAVRGAGRVRRRGDRGRGAQGRARRRPAPRAAAAHTGARRGRPAGLPRADRGGRARLGAADLHELLELAKALAVRRTPARRRRPGSGLAMMTCSGGDSAQPATRRRSAGSSSRVRADDRAPPARAAATRCDCRQSPRLHRDDLGRSQQVARDHRHRRGGSGRRTAAVFYDEPAGLVGDVKRSWDAVREGIIDGAGDSGIAVLSPRPSPSFCSPRPRPGWSQPACPRSRGCGRGSHAPPRWRKRRGTRRGCARSPPWPVALRPRGPGMVGGSPSTMRSWRCARRGSLSSRGAWRATRTMLRRSSPSSGRPWPRS